MMTHQPSKYVLCMQLFIHLLHGRPRGTVSQSKSEMRIEGDQFGGYLNPADTQRLPISLSFSLVTILNCILLSSVLKKSLELKT